MLKRYSLNQQVDIGLTYHLAFSAPMCQARTSKNFLMCGCSSASSSDSCLLNVLHGQIQTSAPFVLFNCFLCAKCALLASVDVMYMAIIATHMSMQVKSMRTLDGISSVATDIDVGPRCRGMLAVPPQGITSGVHGAAVRGGGGEDIPRRGNPGGPKTAGIANEARTSRSRGTRGGRHGDEGCSSKAE